MGQTAFSGSMSINSWGNLRFIAASWDALFIVARSFYNEGVSFLVETVVL